ncbi:MAG: DUF1501 domain-containing protein [Algicola sp.]|nr:DUF1501 domain-containing protein [Algicola sp.]
MKRRQFLKGLLGVAGANALLSGNPLSFKVNTAKAAQGKTLIVIFQRGGCDGLNAVIPYLEERYYELRPTIGVRPPDAADPAAALDINGTFGFHPALAPLLDIYQDGQLAILPTVHYPDATRSHFSGQQFIESGQRLNESDGWLNRHLQTQDFVSSFRAVGFGNELSQSLRGSATAASLTSLNAFSLGVNDAEQSLLLQNMGQVYSQDAGNNPAKKLLHRFGLKVTQDLDLIQAITNQTYTPANGAVYPDNSYGRSLMQIAQLTKSGIGLELATASVGGWDNHSNQGGGEAGGRQARSHANFALGITALYKDLGTLMQDVVIMTQTEFGRTAAENGSGGTDHGYASSWYAMGGGIQSGVYGQWPGLADDQLQQGRFLQRTVDYRDIYAEILTNHLQNNALSTLLPGHTTTPLGLFSAL